MKRILISLLAIVWFGVSASAQQQAPTAPKTKIEAFSAQVGAVIISGYTTGIVVRAVGCAVDLQGREFTDASTGKKEFGIVIRVLEGSRSDHSSYVDYDEIPSLIAGIDYLRKLDPKNATSLDGFQADYRTKGELTVGIFSASTPVAPAGLRAFVDSGRIGKASCQMEIPNLEAIKEGIITIRTKLESIKPGK